eukprot:7536094-Alexandrium_andersonii.AAC.1
MSASLVGSEMCIRDSMCVPQRTHCAVHANVSDARAPAKTSFFSMPCAGFSSLGKQGWADDERVAGGRSRGAA